ncbi:serine/threonine-protein kinase [Lujinxingia litoralis]|nr:serine/threonine-protein kinase [Lujinxingia litoralis]
MIETGEKFGKYTLLERLAVGGMAEIFKARTDGVDGFAKLLAIKRLHRQFSEDSEFASMLIDEAKLVVQLSHGNIGQIFDLGVVNGRYFIAMEFIDGLDLHVLCERVERQHRRLPTEIAVHVAIQLADALHYAHTKLGPDRRPLELVHRDVSPQNVMLSVDGEVKLVDFGIAKARMRAEQTQAGIIKGKFYYMSPEQALGHHIDGRTDVYALGMLLYEVLAGAHPFDSVPDGELLRAVRQADFPPIEQVVPELSPGLAGVIRRALMRNVELRYESALAMKRELVEVARAELLPVGRPELAEFVRAYLQTHLPEETRAAGFEAMQRSEFEASQHSVIFDAARADESSDFEEDQHTQIFMRDEPAVDDLDADAATAMVDWADHDEVETQEKVPARPVPGPALRSAYQEASAHEMPTREAQAPVGLRAPAAVPTAANPAVGFGASLRDLPAQTPRPGVKTPGELPAVGRTQPGVRVTSAIWSRVERLMRTRPYLVGVVLAFVALLVVGLAGWVMWGDDLRAGAAAPVVEQAPAASTHTNLMVSTEPANARVYLDDTFVGATPTTLKELRVGRGYALRFERDGYDVKELQLVAEAQMHPLVMQLEALGGILQIATSPPGAKVYVNGELLGESPVTAMGLSREMEHKVYAELEDASPQEQTLRWEEDDPRVQEVHLSFDVQASAKAKPTTSTSKRSSRRSSSRRSASPKPSKSGASNTAEALNIWELGETAQASEQGTLSVRVDNVDDARIYIDGALVAESARLSDHRLDAGSYEVRVYFTSFKRYSETRTVAVRAGQGSQLVFRP